MEGIDYEKDCRAALDKVRTEVMARMAKCGISKRQLAIQSGVTARTVFMWLNGHSVGINLTTLVRFCMILGVDLKLEERA